VKCHERERSKKMPPNTANTKKMMAKLGQLYERLCSLPFVGEPLARSMSRNLGRMIFYLSGSKTRRMSSIKELKEYLLNTGKEMDFPFEVIEESMGAESFEFTVNGCPYGYNRPNQARACDAAMEMDRVLFHLLGGELTVLDTAPQGVKKCRILLKLRK
jgi:hypothetical protein